jgi:ATP-binding cassette subfamily B protein
VEEALATLRHLPFALGLVWRASPALTVVLGLLTLVSAVVPVAMVHVGKWLVDAVVASATSAPGGDPDVVVRWVVVELGLAGVAVVVGRVAGLCRQLVGERLAVHVNVLVLEKAITLDLLQFEDSDFYDRLSRARREAGSRPLSVVVQVLAMGQNLVSVAGYLASLVVLGWWVVALLVLASVPGFLSELRFSADTFRLRNRQSEDARRLWYMEHLLGSDTHAKEVKVFGLGPFFLGRYRAVAGRLYDELSGMATRRALYAAALSLAATGAFYACYVAIALQAASGLLTIGDLTLYGLAFRQGQAALQGVLGALGTLYESNLYLSNLLAFLATPVRAGLPSGVTAITSPGDGIRFQGVSFAYPGAREPALADVSLAIPAGACVALVGPNGAGKTTFIKVLAGLYPATAGQVLLDGVDVQAWDPAALRRRVAVIFQDFNRYQLPVRDNVGVGSVEHMGEDERVRRAMDRGGAAELLAELPAGLETHLGRWFSRGTELSGGQWQSLALSRAFMREEADILILDEPTASLDAEAEYAVFQRFRALTAGRTSLVISHRFPTVRLADRIFVLAHGRVEEEGTHEALLAAGGTYARMFRLQADGYR